MTRTVRLALVTFAAGFLVEAATELYQFLSHGIRGTGWIGLYYVGLVTTGVGFYLMYRGRHEWTEAHRRHVLRGHQHLWAAIAMFVGALATIAVLSREGTLRGAGAAASPLAWVVGGLVALSFGNFFLGLSTLVDHLASRWGRGCAWAGFAWSLGVAVLTGALVGGELPSLLDEFFTNPLGLVASFAPLAFVMAPLFVSYLLYATAYLDAWRRLAHEAARRAGASVPSGGSPP